MLIVWGSFKIPEIYETALSQKFLHEGKSGKLSEVNSCVNSYFIWVKMKNRKAELIQGVKVSLAKYVDMFRHDCSCNIRFIFTNTKPHIFRISRNQNILNTPWRCLSFSFSSEGIST